MKIGIVWLLIGILVYAEQFALLVGIDNYAGKDEPSTLVGAKNDIEVFKHLLLASGVKEGNIITLTDTQATKNKIQIALKTLESKMKKGRRDRFYYFHAGHGARLNSVGLNTDELSQTAVLLPYEFDKNNADSYLLTQRDLRPLFEKIDKKIHFGLLAFDSCYSGFAHRGLVDHGNKKRYQSRYFEGKITIDKKRMKLVNNRTVYPYKNIVSLSASTATQPSKEDKVLKRGVFSMALERCFQENRVTTQRALKQCLDREYNIQKYVYKTPKKSHTKEVLVLNKEMLKSTKISVYTDMNTSNLKSLNKVANFTDNASSADVELEQEEKGYLLKVLPSGEVINRFRSVDKVRKFISNYRLIRLHTTHENGVDMRITYEHALHLDDNDKIPALTSFYINIDVAKDGYVALFSLSSKGKLYMLHPIERFRRITEKTTYEGNTTDQTGTEFLKVMLFDKPNDLADLKVDNKTGEVLNDTTQIDNILFTAQNHPFRGMTKKITTYKQSN